MATPIARIEHIRQCLRRMRPVMGYELAGAVEIEQELAELEGIFDRLNGMIAAAATNGPQATEEMVRASLNGDTCG